MGPSEGHTRDDESTTSHAYCAAALDLGVADYRFVRRYLERHAPAPLTATPSTRRPTGKHVSVASLDEDRYRSRWPAPAGSRPRH